MTLKIATVFLLFAVNSASNFASAEDLNPGPRSPAEARILYNEISQAMKAAKPDPDIVVPKLERFINRYPSNPNAAEAQVDLTKMYFVQEKYLDAIETAKGYLENHSRGAEANEVRYLTASAYHQFGKIPEAYAMIEDSLRQDPPLETKKSLLLLKADLLGEQGKWEPAKAALDSYTTISGNDGKNDSKYTSVRLLVKTRECAARPAPSAKAKFSEDAWMSYFSEKNRCFKEQISLGLDASLASSINAWCQHFANLDKELYQSKLDKDAKERVQEEIDTTKNFAKDQNPNLVSCHDANPSKK